MSQAEPSQWQCLLQNLGAWQGSFTRFSAAGVQQEEIPSLVTLEGLNDNRTVRQAIQQFSATGQQIYERVLEYNTVNRSTLFFANGAFSQGSLQFGPFSEFGAELGLMAGDRRLRVVQQFDKTSELAQVTLIREHRQHTPKSERPVLSVPQLLGTWQGEATTLYPDWRKVHYSTRLTVALEGGRLVQHLSTPELQFTSTAEIAANRLLFDQGKYPIQVLLLPDGASSNTPLSVPRGLPFFLEAGWLIQDNWRQRMIRSYDAQGGWISLTLINEQKILT
jgi:hypothetical protein